MSHTRASLAKLSIPRLPKIVERERLYRALDGARARPIVWITAPAGFGKTTLAASYLKGRKLKALWYQIDEGDQDPATLFHFLSLGAQRVFPRKKTPLPQLTPEYLPGLPIFARRFFEQLYQHWKVPGLIVLDNYHLLETAETVHGILKIALEVIPDGMNVLVLSRLAPPSTLARLLATQALCVIEEDALRLTLKETQHLITLKAPHGQRPDLARHLIHLAKGWVAGTILTLANPLHPQEISQLDTEPSETVFDYLAHEVLKTLPAATQKVLCRLAYASVFTGAMAQEVSGNVQAASILQGLYHRRYFIERRGENDQTYQFHPLFQVFLRKVAETELAPEEREMLQRRTATLLCQQGQPEKAMALFLDSQNYSEAETLLLQLAPEFFEQGRGQVLEQWVGKFPPAFLAHHPWLLYWRGQGLRMHNLSEAGDWLTKAFRRFEAQNHPEGQLAAWCSLVEAIHLAWSDWTKLDTWLEKLPQVIKYIPDFPATELHAQVVFNMFAFLSIHRSEYADLSRWERYTFSMQEKYPCLLANLPSGFLLPLAFVNRGDIHGATAFFSKMQQGMHSQRSSILSRLSFGYAEAHIEWLSGNLKEANQLIQDCLDYGRQTGCVIHEFPLRFLQIWVAWSDYNFPQAREILDSLAHHFSHGHSPFHDHFQVVSGAIAFLQGDQQKADDHFSWLLKENTTPLPQAIGTSHGFAAQIAYAQQDMSLAQAHLQKTIEIGKSNNNLHCLILGAGTQTLWALNRGDEDQAREYIAEILPIVRAKELQFLHYWPKPQFSLLCAKALEWGIEVEFVQTLVRKFRLMPEEPPVSNPHWPWAVEIRTFGRFELVVDGNIVRFAKKPPRRPLMLLKALVALGGREVPETDLSHALWPDAEGDAVHQTFATTLHRLRKLLGCDDGLTLTDGKLSLNAQRCWLDTWVFEDTLQDSSPKPSGDALETMERLLTVYQGPFLPDAREEPWSFQPRERWRGLFVRHLCRHADFLTRPDDLQRAVILLSQAVEREPETKPLYMKLAHCLRELNQEFQAQAVETQFSNLTRQSIYQ